MAKTFPDRRITDDDMPSLFRSADRTSLSGQRRYVRSVTARSVLAAGAAATGIAAIEVGRQKIDVLAIGTMVLLLCVLSVELYLRSSRPSDEWYDGRAVAESVKSLTWRYAVKGAPYDGVNGSQDRFFLGEVRRLLDDVKVDFEVTGQVANTISDAARELRESPLDVRKSVYIRDRIADQQAWYGGKAAINRKRVDLWGRLLLTFEVVGILAALSKALGWVGFDLAGLVAALIGIGSTRLGLRQYATNSRAYSFASQELSIVRDRLELIEPTSPHAEQEWAAEVADAEEAVSREHTMWRASRSRPE